MKIIIASDKNFNCKECENLYKKNLHLMGNESSFKDLVKNSHFYSFYDEDKLSGCIYVVCENGKLFLNGFSIRKNHRFNVNAIKEVLTFYDCDIYSKTKNKPAEFILRRCGFKLITTNSDGIKYYKKEK